MSKNKVRKTVSFNITNERDVKYLEHIKDINFSGYVKELIDKDLQQKEKLRIIQKNEKGGIKIVVG